MVVVVVVVVVAIGNAAFHSDHLYAPLVSSIAPLALASETEADEKTRYAKEQGLGLVLAPGPGLGLVDTTTNAMHTTHPIINVDEPFPPITPKISTCCLLEPPLLFVLSIASGPMR